MAASRLDHPSPCHYRRTIMARSCKERRRPLRVGRILPWPHMELSWVGQRHTIWLCGCRDSQRRRESGGRRACAGEATKPTIPFWPSDGYPGYAEVHLTVQYLALVYISRGYLRRTLTMYTSKKYYSLRSTNKNWNVRFVLSQNILGLIVLIGKYINIYIVPI
jgi:hypothetical protein